MSSRLAFGCRASNDRRSLGRLHQFAKKSLLSSLISQRSTVIVGLVIQQAIAMFVLKSGAGFSIFKWIALLASDFLEQAQQGAAFFFSADVVALHWFYVNTVCSTLQHLPKSVLKSCYSSLRSFSSSLLFKCFTTWVSCNGLLRACASPP